MADQFHLAQQQTAAIDGRAAIKLGLRWDFQGVSDPVDLDASITVYDQHGSLLDAVFYNKLHSNDDSIIHSGDNRDGAAQGDDEYIMVNLSQLHPCVTALGLTVTCYNQRSLQDLHSAACYIYEPALNRVLGDLQVAAAGNAHGIIMAILYRTKGTNNWELKNIGMPVNARTFKQAIPFIQKLLLDSGVTTPSPIPSGPQPTFQMHKDDTYALATGTGKITLGLGWDIGKKAWDLDASCVVYGGQKSHIVSFSNKKACGGAVALSGDNLTGAGSGDDEMIWVKLNALPREYLDLFFSVTIYSSGGKFRDIKNAYVRLVENDTKSEKCRYSLSSRAELADTNAQIMAALIWTRTGWLLWAIGEPATGSMAKDLAPRIQGIMATHPTYLRLIEGRGPRPKPPPRRAKAVGITIHRGVGLAAKDKNGKSDPYCQIRLSNTSSKKALYKSRVIKKTLNPTWDLKAMVALPKSSRGSSSSGVSMSTAGSELMLIVDVFDKDKFGKDDFMGVAHIMLEDMTEDTYIEQRSFKLGMKLKKLV